MNDSGTVEIGFASLAEFLDVASEFLVNERIFFKLNEALPAGKRLLLIMTLPVIGDGVSCLARVVTQDPEGVLFEVLEWEAGHRARLWRWVALAWKILQAGGDKRFGGPPPGPAARQELRSIVNLDAIANGSTSMHPPSPASRLLNGLNGENERGDEAPARPLPKKARRPLGARNSTPGVEQFPGASSRYVFTSSLKARPLALLLHDMRRENRTGWLDITGANVSRRIRLYEGNVVQVEQRPHPPLQLLNTAIKAVGLNWKIVELHAALLTHADAPEEMLVSLAQLSSDQAERVLSRRISVQLARAIEEGWSGGASFMKEHWPGDPTILLPDPPIPLVRMIWDGLRASVYKRSQQNAEALREQLFTSSLRWLERGPYALEEATLRIEELDLILRCEEDVRSVMTYLAREGANDRMALATVWSLVQLGIIEAIRDDDRPVDAPEEGDVPQQVRPSVPSEEARVERNVPAPQQAPPAFKEPSPAPVSRQAETEPAAKPKEKVEKETEVAPLASLIELEKSLSQKDLFAVLELRWSAHPDEIRPAFTGLLARYRHFTEDSAPEVVAVSQAIIRRLIQAYEVLNDPEKRRSYRELLVGSEIDDQVGRAMSQGGLHYLRGEHQAALRCFEQAVDMAPHREDCQRELARQRATMSQKG